MMSRLMLNLHRQAWLAIQHTSYEISRMTGTRVIFQAPATAARTNDMLDSFSDINPTLLESPSEYYR